MVDQDDDHQVGDDPADEPHREAAQVHPLDAPPGASQLLLDKLVVLDVRMGADDHRCRVNSRFRSP